MSVQSSNPYWSKLLAWCRSHCCSRRYYRWQYRDRRRQRRHERHSCQRCCCWQPLSYSSPNQWTRPGILSPNYENQGVQYLVLVSWMWHFWYIFSDASAQPASARCSSRVWEFPTSVLQSKIRVCGAKRSNESPSGAFKRQNGLRQQMEGPRPDKFADVYTSALLATIVLVLRSSQPVSYTDAQT